MKKRPAIPIAGDRYNSFMPDIVLGLDIGGANLKTATSDGRARMVPFPLWKFPDRLGDELAKLVHDFGSVRRLAVTMTGELCDCYPTKRAGVAAILDAVQFAAQGRDIAIWSTAGEWLTISEANATPLAVASANWHALATFAARFLPEGEGVLVDVGSTTVDVIPIRKNLPVTKGRTDPERLSCGELLYFGVRRTSLAAIPIGRPLAAELFATTLDLFVTLGDIPEDPSDLDTADGRPSTRECAHARLSRMVCGDPEMMSREETQSLARRFVEQLQRTLGDAVKRTSGPCLISGSGEFLARRSVSGRALLSLSELLGPELSHAAPAYAVAKLREER